MSNKYKITKEPLADGGWKFVPKYWDSGTNFGDWFVFTERDAIGLSQIAFTTLDKAVEWLAEERIIMDDIIVKDKTKSENSSREKINYTADGELIVVPALPEGPPCELHTESGKLVGYVGDDGVTVTVPKSPWWKFWQ